MDLTDQELNVILDALQAAAETGNEAAEAIHDKLYPHPESLHDDDFCWHGKLEQR